MTIGVGGRQLRSETVNISPFGAKLRLKERIEPGTHVGLRFRPPGRAPVDVLAIVWRLDADGPAVLFLRAPSEDFPALVAQSARAEETPSPRESRPAATILLVDDDAESRLLAREALEREGYAVLDAGGDPGTALRLAREHAGPIHLLVTDIVIPTMNGLHLVERLGPLRPSMKVILLSAAPVAGLADSGALFLPKPFDVEELTGRVREMLNGWSAFTRRRGGRPPNAD